MVLVGQAIRTSVKTLIRIDKRYRYLDPTNKFIQKYVPPGYRKRAFKIKRYVDVAIGGALIYDVIDEIYNGFQTGNGPKAYKQYKTYRGHKYYNTRSNKYYSADKYKRGRQSRTGKHKQCACWI